MFSSRFLSPYELDLVLSLAIGDECNCLDNEEHDNNVQVTPWSPPYWVDKLTQTNRTINMNHIQKILSRAKHLQL